MRLPLILCLVAVTAFASAPHRNITPELTTELATAAPDELVSCLVYMKADYPFTAAAALPVEDRIATFRAVAAESQSPVIAWLDQMPDEAEVRQQFWVMNGFHLQAAPRVIRTLAERNDIGWISHNGMMHIIAEPTTGAVPDRLDEIEWNIRKVMADSCWEAGYTGEGIVIGLTDTGVDHTHPALAGKWSGHWHVSEGLPQTPEPYDDHGHGTHCMGTILGGEGLGVAPGATFAAAKVMGSSGGSYAQLIEGLQFMADIKESVDVRVVSNSWGSTNALDTTIYPVSRTLLALNILPVFAIGNSGSRTTCTPGNYATVVGVGATDSLDRIAGLSSRGPAPDEEPWNNPDDWFRPDWNLIKPNISAPGVAIRSCVPDSNYRTMDGTSMACPHIAGAVALLLEKNPTLTPKRLYDILLDNSDQPSGGGSYPNNSYGWGRLNVWRAIQNTPELTLPFIYLQSQILSDPPPGGNGNGIFEPGETAELTISIRNIGLDAHEAEVLLQTDDRYITVIDSISTFGSIPNQGRADNSSNPFRFTAHPLTPEGYEAELQLLLLARGDDGEFRDSTTINVQVGTRLPPYSAWKEDFEYHGGRDSLRNYWYISDNWTRSTFDYHSPDHSAYNNNERGLYEMRLRNSLSIPAFAESKLSFWQKYHFTSGVRVFAEVSDDGGVDWTQLWSNPEGRTDSIPWTEYVFPLSRYRGREILISFRTAITGGTGTQRWFLDDIQLLVETDNVPPEFSGTTRWCDTLYTGPFRVTSRINDHSGVDSVHLYYRVNDGEWTRLVMSEQSDDIYHAEIPEQELEDRIDYYLWARDNWPAGANEGTDPVGAPAEELYSFRITAIGIEENPDGSNRVYGPLLQPNPAHGLPVITFGLPVGKPVRLAVFDLTGRMVRSLLERQTIGAGETNLTWDRRDDRGRTVATGVYFVRLETDSYRSITKLILTD